MRVEVRPEARPRVLDGNSSPWTVLGTQPRPTGKAAPYRTKPSSGNQLTDSASYDVLESR